jgi:hypothetical protein
LATSSPTRFSTTLTDVTSVTRIDKVVGAFLGGEAVEECADLPPGGLDSSRISLAQQGFEFCEDLLDRVEVRRIARQEEQLGTDGADQLTDGTAFVAAEIVHDDNVTGGQGGQQELLDIGAEAGAVDRPVDDAGRRDAVAAQGRQEG